MNKVEPRNNVVFLFGAGASVPAGIKTTSVFTDWLIHTIEHDYYLKTKYPCLKSIWELLEWFSINFQNSDQVILHKGDRLSNRYFYPNFEYFIYLIELLENFNDVIPNMPLLNNARFMELLENLGCRDVNEAYLASSYGLARLSSDIRKINPLSQYINFKGPSAKYMHANKALVKLIAEQFPNEFNLEYLKQFYDVVNNHDDHVVIATTNYDLVFDKYFNDYQICFQDGFSKISDQQTWEGFSSNNDDILYLKLHGSLNWYNIKDDWLKNKPEIISINDIYKIPSMNIVPLLNDKLKRKYTLDQDFKHEINVPHLIMGGLKDKKILDIPFIEIHREWQNSLSTASTLVIVGVGFTDIHLLSQMRGLLLTNKNIEKIVIINPDVEAHKAFNAFMRNVRIRRSDQLIFNIISNWDLELLKENLMPIQEIINLGSSELNQYFQSSKGKDSYLQ